jgi:hypothetical protein
MWYKDSKTLKDPEIQMYQLTVAMSILNTYKEDELSVRNVKDLTVEAWLLGAVGMTDYKLTTNTSYIR